MKTFRILLDDLIAAGFEPEQNEKVYELHLEIAHEAGLPYVYQVERYVGDYEGKVEGKPHLFCKWPNSQVHTRNCYVKRDYKKFPSYASRYIPI